MGSPRPHLRRDWGSPTTSAPGLGLTGWFALQAYVDGCVQVPKPAKALWIATGDNATAIVRSCNLQLPTFHLQQTKYSMQPPATPRLILRSGRAT